MSVAETSNFAILKHRPFLQFFSSRIIASLANQMQTVAVAWQVYEMTGRPFDLGLVGAAQFLPLALLTLVAGQVADRYNRKTIVSISQAVDGCAMALLALGTFGGWLTRDVILAIVVMFGTARVFQQPTQQSMLPLIVPPTLLSRAIALNSSSNQLAQIVGPAIGGLLLAISTPLVYVLCALLYFVAAILTLLIRFEREGSHRTPVTLQGLFAGIGFIWRREVILGSLTFDLFAVVLGSVNAMLPIYAKDIFHVGPEGLGLLRLSPAIGALIMSFALVYWPIHRRAGPIMFTTVAIFGAATILFGLSGHLVPALGLPPVLFDLSTPLLAYAGFPTSISISTSMTVAMIALAITGASDLVSVVIRSTLIQFNTPDEMRGRVSAVNFLFIGSSNQIGDFRAGLTAEYIGAVNTVLIGGAGIMAVVGVCAFLFPKLLRIDRLENLRGS